MGSGITSGPKLFHIASQTSLTISLTETHSVIETNTSNEVSCRQKSKKKKKCLMFISFLGNIATEKWEKSKRCFCNARNRRREETKSGMASKKKSVWKYEPQMSFIILCVENRK